MHRFLLHQKLTLLAFALLPGLYTAGAEWPPVTGGMAFAWTTALEPAHALDARGSTEVMAVVGSVDPYTPTDHVQELRDRGVDVVHYEGADHGFVHDPTRPSHRADDAADAWDRVLTFLAG